MHRVLEWTSPASIDFDNSHRKAANTSELRFDKEAGSIKPRQGAYLVEFNEIVSVPLDYMGQAFVRSSLRRSGATLTAGVVDAGYEGALGALLDVKNPARILLYQDAKLGQIVTVHVQHYLGASFFMGLAYSWHRALSHIITLRRHM